MNLKATTNILVNCAIEDRAFVSKMSNLLRTCEHSTNLMVGIYLVEKNHFFYCNNNLKKILGDCCPNLIEEGWNFLYSMVDPIEVGFVKNKISNLFSTPYLHDLLNLKYHITCCCGKKIFIKHEIILRQMEKHLLAINYFFDITEKEKIEQCIKTAPKAINSHSSLKTIFTISPREKQVLRLISNGFSSKEIADMLFISNHTAVSHRKNLIKKFQVKNTAHLVKKASALNTL